MLLRFLNGLDNYYRRFGIRGWLYLLKRANKYLTIIKFRHPGFSHPIYVRNNTSDLGVFKQILIKQDYKITLPFEPKVIFDLGANVGLAAVYFKNRYPGAKIICVEPEASNYEILKKNTENYPNILCFNAGIWSRDTSLFLLNKGEKWGFMVDEVDDKNAGNIRVITIETLMKELSINKIDIMKIDIEGSERELFSSNCDFWLSRTKVIIIELHDHLRAGSSKVFFKALNNYNFSLTRRGENLIIELQN